MKKRNLLLTILSTSVFASCMIGCSNSNHTVTFDTDGGTEIASQNIAHNALAIEPNDPVKLPYGFTGWYTDKDYANAFDFTQPITQNITLHAKWSNTIEFTYLYHSDDELNTIAFKLSADIEDPISEVSSPLTIDWGDGEIKTYTKKEDVPETLSHTYTKGENEKTIYKVTILGLVKSLEFDNNEGCHFIQSINVNELMHPLTGASIKLGSVNKAHEPSQVSEITLPRSLPVMLDESLKNTSIKEFVIGKHISAIGVRAFIGLTTLENIDFSKATLLHAINPEVFWGCTKINSIVLPENLAVIANKAFNLCINLTTVTFTAKIPPILGTDAFDAETVKTIYVPKGCKSTYTSHWNDYYPDLVSKLVESE